MPFGIGDYRTFRHGIQQCIDHIVMIFTRTELDQAGCPADQAENTHNRQQTEQDQQKGITQLFTEHKI